MASLDQHFDGFIVEKLVHNPPGDTIACTSATTLNSLANPISRSIGECTSRQLTVDKVFSGECFVDFVDGDAAIGACAITLDG